MRRFKEIGLIVVYAVLLSAVAVVHFGCEDEPAGPDCGEGPFSRDSKTGVCKSLSTGSVVDSACCP
jgi:hypothetical protein